MLGEYINDIKQEFAGYNKKRLLADILSGITVAAVALPLALAFGVSSGADAAAGLITAIVSAFVIGMLSGGCFQISGPTGAMAAILIPLAARNGFVTVLQAGMLSGVILLMAGILKAGRITSFLPKSVITGFTSGIAIIIALGQVENFIGIKSSGEEAYIRVLNLFKTGSAPNPYAMGLGIFVVLFILIYPKKWNSKLPASLVSVIIATTTQIIFKFPVDKVGEIPKTIIHGTRIEFSDLISINLETLLMPAISIAALGMIESLLCGAVGAKMSGKRFDGNRELVAQGIGNMMLPLFGGVPATAAIARTSVAIKSGTKTRVSGIFQGIMLLLSMFLLGSFMSQIPLSALAGVLMVTAWRMNEWESIRYIFKNRFKSAISKFGITLICTVVFDLTIAIAVGSLLSMLLFIVKESDVEVTVSELDPARLKTGIKTPEAVRVIYITGAVFFGSTGVLAEKLRAADGSVLIMSIRGVPSVDISGVEEMLEFCKNKKKDGVKILFCGVQPKVKKFFDRAGLTQLIGEDNFFWVADDAIRSLDEGIQ